MKKRAVSLLAAAVLLLAGLPSAAAEEKACFTDVPAASWYYPYASELCRAGVMTPFPDGSFRGGDSVTWGQAFRLILAAIGCVQPEDGQGRAGDDPYIQPAIDNRLVDAFDGDCLAQTPTRLQVAGMAARALDLVSIAGPTPYQDCDDGYAVELYEKGIMQGAMGEDGLRYFYPEEPVTRAEMAAILWRMMAGDATEGMFRYSNYWLDVLPGVEPLGYDPAGFSLGEDGLMSYAGGAYTLGVDVSGYQGDVDWAAVKAAGIDFALIRVGGRFMQSGDLYDDSCFQRNVEGALEAGLDVGVYFFSQAITEEEGLEEAQYVLERIEGYPLAYPVIFDWEYLGGSTARTYGVEPDRITGAALAFCGAVEEAGYTPMIYFNAYCGYIKLDLSMVDQYDFWYAQYASRPDFRYHFRMWQYANDGRIDGIDGDVDLNICLKEYGG